MSQNKNSWDAQFKKDTFFNYMQSKKTSFNLRFKETKDYRLKELFSFQLK